MSDPWKDRLQQLTNELRRLESTQLELGGLPAAAWRQIRELNAKIITEITAGPPREERRVSLRLAAQATVRVVSGCLPSEVLCRDFSLGGLLLETDRRVPLGTRVTLESMTLLDEIHPLEIAAVVVRYRTVIDSSSATAPAGLGLRFVDLTSELQARVSHVFDRLLAVASERPDLAHLEDWGFHLRDDAQLGAVCNALVRLAGLGELWTEEGPNEAGRAQLRNNGSALRPGKRAMLLIVWRLWNGEFDLRGLPLLDIDAQTQRALVTFFVAARRSPDAVDRCLRESIQEVPAVARSGCAKRLS